MFNRTTPVAELPQFLTIEEVAAYLGVGGLSSSVQKSIPPKNIKSTTAGQVDTPH
jgi:hypothetical protein